MDTLFLFLNDLAVDSDGNIARASNGYSLAQDAASQCKTFAGEVYYDNTQGIPYWSNVLGKAPNLEYLRAQYVAAASAVPEVTSVQVFFDGVVDRVLTGQIQVTGPKGVVVGIGF